MIYPRRKEIIMRNLRQISLAITVCFLLSFTGCSLISAKEYEIIQGRDYQLQKVYFIQKGATQQTILKAMHSIQVIKTMRLMEHKYNINIDCTEFDIFLLNDDATKIKAEGLLSKTEFTWESKTIFPNIIEYTVTLDSFSNPGVETKDYSIIIKVGGKEAARINGNFLADAPTFQETAKRLNYQKKEVPGEVYTNLDTMQDIDLNAVSEKKAGDAEVRKLKEYITKQKEIQTLIKSQTETLPSEYRQKYKDDIVNYLDEVLKD